MDPFDYTFWLASRAAGIVGFIALGIVSVLGLVSALKLVSPATAARLRPWHERLALTGLGCIAAHGVLLLGDTWLHPGIVGILVPFQMDYRPLWTGLGIIAAYALAAFALSFYQRRRIGARRWRSAHRFASIAFVLGGLHALMAGTDARSPLLLAVILSFGVVIGLMVAARALRLPVRKAPPRPARGAVAVPSPSRSAPPRGRARAHDIP
jgi:methionine sulfoxide reductase heme-binding subunit